MSNRYKKGDIGGEEMYCPNCGAILEWDEGYDCPFTFCPECGNRIPEKSEA